MGTFKTKRPARFHRHVDLDDGAAFVPDFRAGFVEISDGDAEAFGEEFIASATSGETAFETARDETYAEELGAFVVDTLFDDDVEPVTSPDAALLH